MQSDKTETFKLDSGRGWAVLSFLFVAIFCWLTWELMRPVLLPERNSSIAWKFDSPLAAYLKAGGLIAAFIWTLVNMIRALTYRVTLSPEGISVNRVTFKWDEITKVEALSNANGKSRTVLHRGSDRLTILAGTDAYDYIIDVIKDHSEVKKLYEKGLEQQLVSSA